jgi:hypothetical protein
VGVRRGSALARVALDFADGDGRHGGGGRRWARVLWCTAVKVTKDGEDQIRPETGLAGGGGVQSSSARVSDVCVCVCVCVGVGVDVDVDKGVGADTTKVEVEVGRAQALARVRQSVQSVSRREQLDEP